MNQWNCITFYDLMSFCVYIFLDQNIAINGIVMSVFVVYFILVFLYIFGIAKVKNSLKILQKFHKFIELLECNKLFDSIPLLRLLHHVDVLHSRHRRPLPRQLCAREKLLDFRVHQNLPGNLQLFTF